MEKWWGEGGEAKREEIFSLVAYTFGNLRQPISTQPGSHIFSIFSPYVVIKDNVSAKLNVLDHWTVFADPY